MRKRKRLRQEAKRERQRARDEMQKASSAGPSPDANPSHGQPGHVCESTVPGVATVEIQTPPDPLADARGRIMGSFADRVASSNSLSSLIDSVAAGILADAIDTFQGRVGRRRRASSALRGEHGHFANGVATQPDCRLCVDASVVDASVEEILAHSKHRAIRAIGARNGNLH